MSYCISHLKTMPQEEDQLVAVFAQGLGVLLQLPADWVAARVAGHWIFEKQMGPHCDTVGSRECRMHCDYCLVPYDKRGRIFRVRKMRDESSNSTRQASDPTTTT